MAILLPAELGDLKPEMPDHLFGGRDDSLHQVQFGLGRHQRALCGRRAGLRRGKGGAQNSDLRGGFQHVECLP
jgi:hypothetical protein